MKRRQFLRASAQTAPWMMAFTAVHTATAATTIVAVRVWPAEEYSRVTIESDAPLVARHALHSDPARLSIDIDGLELSDALRELVGKIRPDDPFISRVRIAQYQPRVVRMVLDLKQSAEPQIFTLQPVAAYRHRLVFDLYPSLPADPLLALVREKEQAERQATKALRSVLPDPLDKGDGRHGGAVASLPAPRPSGAAPGPTPDQRRRVDRLIVVAIDPGHGGEDPGAIGPTGLREKDVVLSVALQLRDKLNANPSMRAFLTRDADYFVPLHERVRKARRVQADLFVSIHADAFDQPRARGASVFALSERGASSTSARWLANKENAADDIGGMNVKAIKGRQDPHMVKTILDMSTAAQIKDSLKLGGEVLHQLDRVGRLHKQQVEQAGFAVLKAPDIPSILVETAFISNPAEEKKLRDADYQSRLVDALHTGIRRYFTKHPPLGRTRSL